jgi:hypothetical protein
MPFKMGVKTLRMWPLKEKWTKNANWEKWIEISYYRTLCQCYWGSFFDWPLLICNGSLLEV